MEGYCGDVDSTELLKLKSITTVGTSEFVTPSADSASSSSPLFVSSRIERMMQARGEYATDVEFEIEASKDHWSHLESASDTEEVKETNLEAFRRLQKEWGGFFYDFGDRLKVGRKIAEGGQAEIFEAHMEYPNGNKVEYALKVFKEAFFLRDLEKQWPQGMLQRFDSGGIVTRKGVLLYDGTLLPNGRFAFRMQKCWGDLRKLIDLRMKQNHNQCSPFTDDEAFRIMFDIAQGMAYLHESNVVHRDLKASNVLLYPFRESDDLKVFNPDIHRFTCDITDYESSLAIVGTRFWRAPEILLAVKNNNVKSHIFTRKSDVYSYAMTCYEILTGCIPLEGFCSMNYDHVLRGGRPKLPENIQPILKVLLNSCWHQDAIERPSFPKIVEFLKKHGVLTTWFGS